MVRWLLVLLLLTVAAAPADTPCDDGDPCTGTDVCRAGACVGLDPVVCAARDGCHLPGACDPGTGACSDPVAPDDTPCDDGNACTQIDHCAAGTCAVTDPVVCTAPDDCHLAGTCDPGSGACFDPAAPDDTPCDDGRFCSVGDRCVSGACRSGGARDCTSAGDMCNDGVCDEDADRCVARPKPGTQCDDANPCT